MSKVSTSFKTRHCLNHQGQNYFQFRSEPRHSIPNITWGSVWGQREKTNGEHFGDGIISTDLGSVRGL